MKESEIKAMPADHEEFRVRSLVEIIADMRENGIPTERSKMTESEVKEMIAYHEKFHVRDLIKYFIEIYTEGEHFGAIESLAENLSELSAEQWKSIADLGGLRAYRDVADLLEQTICDLRTMADNFSIALALSQEVKGEVAEQALQPGFEHWKDTGESSMWQEIPWLK